MADTAAKNLFSIQTHLARSKKRMICVEDEGQLTMMKVVGLRLDALPKMVNQTDGEFVCIYVLPTSNVLEVYRRGNGREVGFVFSNIDVWMTYPVNEAS